MLGLGNKVTTKTELSGPSVITADRSLWAPFDSPDNVGLSPITIDIASVGGSGPSAGTRTVVGNTLVLDGCTTTGTETTWSSVGFVSGVTYKVQFTISNWSAGVVNLSVGNTQSQDRQGNGTYTDYVTYGAGDANSYVYANPYSGDGGFTGTISDISYTAVNSYAGQALHFDGVADYIKVDDVENVIGGDLNTFTMAIWIYQTNTTASHTVDYGTMFFVGDINGNNNDTMAYIGSQTANNQLIFSINKNNGGSRFQIKVDSGNLTYEKWYRVVGVYDGTQDKIYLYLNGSLIGTDTPSDEAAWSAGDAVDFKTSGNDCDMLIGGGGTQITYIEMYASDAQFWNKAWSAEDVAYDFNNPESLALGASGTSLTSSDLRLWYPMQDNHRGDQAPLLDGAKTGVLGPELVDNGTFDNNNIEDGSGTVDWTLGSRWSATDNKLKHTAGGSGNEAAQLSYVASGTIVAGALYKVTCDLVVDSGNGPAAKIGNASSTTELNHGIGATTYLTAGSTTNFLIFIDAGAGTTFTIDNISVKLVMSSLKKHGTSTFFGDQLWETEGHSSDVGTFTNGSGELRNGGGSATEIASGNLVHNKWYEISARDGVDFTDYGAPNNNVGTVFCLNHDDGSSVPAMDENDKVYLIDLNWVPYDSHALHIDSNALYVAFDDTGSPGANGTYMFLRATNDITSDLVVGRRYKFTCDAKVGHTDDSVNVIVNDTNTVHSTTVTSTSYVEVSHTFIAGDATSCYVRVEGMASGEEIWLDNVSLKEAGFATGWTDADSQPAIPQLAFQSYNELAWFNGTDEYVALGNQSVGADKSITMSAWIFMIDSGTSAIQPILLFGDTHLRAQSDTSIKMYPDQGVGATTVTVSSLFNKWHHIVYTSADGDTNNTNTLYIDGALIASGANGGNTSTDSVASYIGRHGSDYFSGAITEVSYWEEALTATKVQELYNGGEALDATLHSSVANLVGYWRNMGVRSWTDLDPTNTNHGTPTSPDGTLSASLMQSLILPEGQNGRDAQGFIMNRARTSGLNLPVNNNIVNSYIDLGATTTISAGTAYSVSAWVRPYDYTGGRLGWIGADSGDYIYINNATTIIVRQNSGNQTFTVSAMTLGEWVNIAVTRTTGNVITVYVNGVINGGASTSTITDADSFQYRYLGTKFATNQSYSFEGDIDDIAIYTTALTQAQIERNYKAGKRRHQN